MNLKKVNNMKIYKQTTLNYSNGQLIIDKTFITKKPSYYNFKQKRLFGKNILNTTLTDVYKYENKLQNNKKSFNSKFNNRERSRENSLQSKTKKSNKIFSTKIYNNNVKNKIRLTTNNIIKKQNDDTIKNNQQKILKVNKKDYNNINSNNNILDFYIFFKKDLNTKSLFYNLNDNNNNKNFNNIIENNHKFTTQTDLQYVKEYQEEIFSYLTSLEEKIKIYPNYISEQKEITEKMREILIDWIINVHLKYKLLDETLFLTVILIDRYLQKVQISRKYLQLVGVASLLIACKYEEIYPPLIKSFIYITDNAYNKDELLNMEKKILSKLEFNICFPSPLRYMEMLCIKLNYINDKILINKMHFLLELFLTKLIYYKFSHIELVIACFLLSNKSNDEYYEEKKEDLMQKCFSCFFVFYDKNKINRIYECIDELEISVKDLYENKNSFKTLQRKYSLEKYGGVSEPKLWKNIIY